MEKVCFDEEVRWALLMEKSGGHHWWRDQMGTILTPNKTNQHRVHQEGLRIRTKKVSPEFNCEETDSSQL